MDYKANIWNECLKQNVFSNCKEDELPRIQELFEETLEESKDIDEIISVLRIKIQQISYKDLIPSEKKPIIDFSDKVEEEPLQDLDKLIAEKQKERQNDEPIKGPSSSSPIDSLSPVVSAPSIVSSSSPIVSSPPIVSSSPVVSSSSNELQEIKKIVLQQNLILEKILESQIKLLRQKK
jgi:hypothetical protein